MEHNPSIPSFTHNQVNTKMVHKTNKYCVRFGCPKPTPLCALTNYYYSHFSRYLSHPLPKNLSQNPNQIESNAKKQNAKMPYIICIISICIVTTSHYNTNINKQNTQITLILSRTRLKSANAIEQKKNIRGR